MEKDQRTPSIGKLEIERKNTSQLFKDGKFRPENLPHKKSVSSPISKSNHQEPKDIFDGKSQVSKREIYYNLLKDPELAKIAYEQGKKPWQLAKEITESFPKKFGGNIDKSEARREFNYLEYWKIIHEQQEGHITYQKARKIKHEKEEREFLKKKFGI